MSYLTARSDLEALADLKLLRKRKEGVTSIYISPAAVGQMLEKL